MSIKERIRLVEADLLEDQITVTDPRTLVKSWTTTKRYRRARAGSGKDELREFACPEGLEIAK